MFQIRAMQHGDIETVMQIQAECYVLDAIEPQSTFIDRLHTSPKTAWVVEDTLGVCAYLVGYYSTVGNITPLGGRFKPTLSNCLYLHDLAILPRVAGQRLGVTLVNTALSQQPDHIQYTALVSIQNSVSFWQKIGFETQALDTDQTENLQTYPQPAFYMLKRLIK
ncbi:GNAT family N-acetyltransferase [Aquirhabdus parva]|nr:GNAT family N-acetyltransferase [Aquirhabdus parva]